VTRSPSRRRRPAALLALVGLGAFLIWWLAREDEAEVELEEIEDVSFAEGRVPSPPGTPPTDVSPAQPGREALPPRFGQPAEGAAEQTGAVESYLARTQYPPASRPLNAQQHQDLIDWNARDEYATPTRENPDVTILYSGERFFVLGTQEAIHTYIDVRRSGRAIPIRVLDALVEAHVRTEGERSVSEPVTLTYREQDGRQVNDFDPSALGLDRPARLRFQVRFDWGGSEPAVRQLWFNYYPQASLTGRFTGQFREAVEEGSLALYAEVEIRKAGWFNIDCNLWDSQDLPVAWARFKGELTEGTHEVRLPYFGKVLVDSESQPPWHIGELRGQLFNPGGFPPEELMEPFEGDYQTAPYSLDDFSDERWDDPRREEMLEGLQRAEDEGFAPTSPISAEDQVERSGSAIAAEAARNQGDPAAPAPGP